MADSVWDPSFSSRVSAAGSAPRHSAAVRVTHWLTTLGFAALLVTGVEILISHPRLYWGETGNVFTPSLIDLPIPASRAGVKTGYSFVLPDQNGWSRSLHFQAAWLTVFTALVYGAHSVLTGHFRKNLFGAGSYGKLQRGSYAMVVFLLFPLMIWTGLAMSPSLTSAFPNLVTVFGGQQSARTIHFFGFALLAGFVVVHVAMVWRTGFRRLMAGMIRGGNDD